MTALWARLCRFNREFRAQHEYSGMKYVAIVVLILLIIGVSAYTATRPSADVQDHQSSVVADGDTGAKPTPLTAALSQEIQAALKATQWPTLEPSMESVITGPSLPPEVTDCGGAQFPDALACTWGPFTAKTHIVLVADSVGLTYAAPLREIALNSGGQIQVHTEAMRGCSFIDDRIATTDKSLLDACPARKNHVIDVINHWNPDVLIISQSYGARTIAGSNQNVTTGLWSKSMLKIAETIRNRVKKFVFLSPPPAGIEISECYPAKAPADCVSQVPKLWRSMAVTELEIAKSLNGLWIDSRQWFCNNGKRCPSFVGSIPTKRDTVFMAPPYGEKIYPAIEESLRAAGVF